MTTEPLPLPHNPAAEASVIASICVDPEALERIDGLVSAAEFHDKLAGQCFAAALALSSRGEAVNEVTVAAELRGEDGVMPWLARITGELPTPVGVEHYAGIVRRDAQWRKAIQAGARLVQRSYQGGADVDDALAAAGRELEGIADPGAGARELVSLGGVIDRWWERPGIYAAERASAAVRSGLVAFDEVLGGIWPGELCVIAARTGRGKSLLLLNIARNAALAQNLRVLVCSLEMSRDEWAVRALARESGIDSRRIFESQLSDIEEHRLMRATGELHPLAIDLDDRAQQTVERVRRSVRAVRQRRGGCDLVLVDYLQLMRGPRRGENRTQEVGEISRGLKELARDFDVPVVAAAQLSRQADNRPKGELPKLSDLRESGSIEQDADKVVFLVRGEEVHKDRAGTALLVVAKNRNGPTGKCAVRVDPATSLCADIDAPEEPEYEQEAMPAPWAR